jgi:hypothetical protein
LKICINHLTRMSAPRICVAGIDLETRDHVRPITGRANTMTRDLLAENGGIFEVGSTVELGSVTPNPSPPETEDHWFWPDLDHLDDVLGPALRRQGWKYAVDAGTGSASLGILRVEHPRLDTDQYGGLQVRLEDVEPRTYLKVTDLRYFEDDHKTVRSAAVEDAQTRIRRGVRVHLMLGLARAFIARGDDEERHWLQVNGICLGDDPYSP